VRPDVIGRTRGVPGANGGRRGERIAASPPLEHVVGDVVTRGHGSMPIVCSAGRERTISFLSF
jgi:hypothetical protein